MASLYKDIDYQLKSGKEVKCPKCHEGIIKPYNASPDKAHLFNCTNKKCDFSVHYEPSIMIE